MRKGFNSYGHRSTVGYVLGTKIQEDQPLYLRLFSIWCMFDGETLYLRHEGPAGVSKGSGSLASLQANKSKRNRNARALATAQKLVAIVEPTVEATVEATP